MGFTLKVESHELHHDKIVVLYTNKDTIMPKLPKNCCKYYSLEKLPKIVNKAKIVIVSGHGAPPVYAGHSANEVELAVSKFKPELIVMNSCFGASSPILESLSNKNTGALIVAPPFPIYLPGYKYLDNFFNEKLSLNERARNVITVPYYPQLIWKINKTELTKAKSKVLKMSKSELKQNYRRRVPPLIRVKINENNNNSEILVLLTKEEVEKIKK